MILFTQDRAKFCTKCGGPLLKKRTAKHYDGWTGDPFYKVILYCPRSVFLGVPVGFLNGHDYLDFYYEKEVSPVA
jgi:hypothetical protein